MRAVLVSPRAAACASCSAAGRAAPCTLLFLGADCAGAGQTDRHEGDADEQKERQFPRLKKPELNQRRAGGDRESGQPRQQQQAERVGSAHHLPQSSSIFLLVEPLINSFNGDESMSAFIARFAGVGFGALRVRFQGHEFQLTT